MGCGRSKDEEEEEEEEDEEEEEEEEIKREWVCLAPNKPSREIVMSKSLAWSYCMYEAGYDVLNLCFLVFSLSCFLLLVFSKSRFVSSRLA